MRLVNMFLRIVLTLVLLYFIVGAILLAYHEIVIYPDVLAPVFEPIAKNIVLIHNAGKDVMDKLYNAFNNALHQIGNV